MISNSTTQFHTDPLSSTRRFHTRTTPFQHPKSLSSTPKSPQFHTKNFFVWGVSWTEGCVELEDFGLELRGFWCWTEGFWVLKRCGPCVKLMCGTERYSLTRKTVQFSELAVTFKRLIFLLLSRTLFFYIRDEKLVEPLN